MSTGTPDVWRSVETHCKMTGHAVSSLGSAYRGDSGSMDMSFSSVRCRGVIRGGRIQVSKETNVSFSRVFRS